MSTSPPDPSGDAVAAPGPTSSNFTLLYLIVAVLVAVILYIAVRHGRSVLSEWRHLHGAGDGGSPHDRAGLSVDDIAALPTFMYRALAASPPMESGGGVGDGGSRKGRMAVECVVCLQEMVDGDVVRVLPACRHFFHGSCIDLWLSAHSTCPVCRAHPEPDRARLGDGAVSPPLPQLLRCGLSPERPAATRILADILARSPLRGNCSTSGSAKETTAMLKSPSLSSVPMARDCVVSRSPSPSPSTYGSLDERWSNSPPPRMLEVVIVRSKTPSPMMFSRETSTRSVGVLEAMDMITSASPAWQVARTTKEGVGSRSKSLSPSPVTHYAAAEWGKNMT